PQIRAAATGSGLASFLHTPSCGSRHSWVLMRDFVPSIREHEFVEDNTNSTLSRLAAPRAQLPMANWAGRPSPMRIGRVRTRGRVAFDLRPAARRARHADACRTRVREAATRV